MLRQATIDATRESGGKHLAVRLTILHDTLDDAEGGLISIKVNGGQPITVNADELREAIADVLPKEAA